MPDSELRRDVVSGDWVVIAPKRGKRPHDFVEKSSSRKRSPKGTCPFEDPQKSGNSAPLLLYPKNKPEEWTVQIIKNKYPAFEHDGLKCVAPVKEGLYEVAPGVGYHHLLILRDHDTPVGHLTKKRAGEMLQALQEHYNELAMDECVEYVSLFHNWGPKAGASVYHPHLQMMAIPIIPRDVASSLRGSKRYHAKKGGCVHCAILEWETRQKKRILYKSNRVIAFTPFISRDPFEFRIFPRKHNPYFEDEKQEVLEEVADVLRKLLRKTETKLGDPDLNFFIHSAPVKNKKKYGYYHWHIEVLPKFSISAGFELGTGIEVTVVDPDEAAKMLRIQK